MQLKYITETNVFKYTSAFVKWVLISIIIGSIGGVIGSIFHICIDKVTEFRLENDFIIYFLPVGGLIIAGLYHMCVSQGKIDTNRVLESVDHDEKVPFVMMPLIFISTVLTHLLGGSAGREGAALQLGGSIGYKIGKIFKLNKSSMRIIVMSGMSAVFSALFGTPITAAIFSLEVSSVGRLHYTGLVPCSISAISAYMISQLFGLDGVRFEIPFEAFTISISFRVIIFALLAAIISILFCVAIHKCENIANKFIKNCYIRAFIGGVIILVLSLLVNTRDYNGAGMDVIERAMTGDARYEAFILKILFTSITIAAGFKGGEIVPAFFIGSTFGCVVGPLFGINPVFSAAIGFIAVFCGVVNCPMASIILSIEVFGAGNLMYFALAVAISYMMSGRFGLYHSQRIVYSKISDEIIETERN